MAKGTKAASGSRGSARPGPGVGGVMKKPAGAKKNPSALLDPGRSAQRARHWSHAEAERQVVQLLVERLHMRKAIRRALGHSKTAVLALCDAFEDGAPGATGARPIDPVRRSAQPLLRPSRGAIFGPHCGAIFGRLAVLFLDHIAVLFLAASRC